MATEKVFLPVLILLTLNLTVEGNSERFKYNQSPQYFLDTNSLNLVPVKEAVDFVLDLLECDITKAERKFKKEIPIWKIDLITKERGTLEVELSSIDKSLLRINAAEGPFDYELKPEPNFISFSEAKKTAEEFTGQKILKWNYFKNKNIWEYNFWLFTKSGKAQVRIDAESGELIVSKKKK